MFLHMFTLLSVFFGGGEACLAHLASSDNPLLCPSLDSHCKWLMLIVTVRFWRKLFQNDGCTNPAQSQRIDCTEFWNSLALNHKRGDLTGPDFSAVMLESRHVQQNQQNETRQ